MSILIKGMEMPNNCWECPLVDTLKDCPCYSMPDEEFWKPGVAVSMSVHEDCPIIPVQPHGKLGDLDKLADNMRSATAGMEHRAIIMHEIRRAPTVVPAEEDET